MVKEYLDIAVFKKANIYFYILACVSPYVCVHHVCVCCGDQKKMLESSETELTDSCKLPNVSARNGTPVR